MAKSVKKTKKKVHVDAVGVAHIKASFNNIIVPFPMFMVTQFPGLLQVKMALRDPEKILRLLLRFRLNLLLRKLMI